jgi:hypothetical protein
VLRPRVDLRRIELCIANTLMILTNLPIIVRVFVILSLSGECQSVQRERGYCKGEERRQEG